MKKLLFLFVILLLPNLGEAKDLDIIEVDNDLKAKIWLNEYKNNPLVSVKIAFKNSGAIYDDIQGLSLLLSGVITEGAGRFKSQKFKQILEDNAITISASSDMDNIMISMSCLRDNLDTAFKMLSLTLAKPRFDDESIELVRRQITAVRSNREQNPLSLAELEFRKNYFGDFFYGRDIYGEDEILKNIHKADLKEAMNKKFTTNRMMISVAGNISEKELKFYVKKHLSMLPITDNKREEINFNNFVKENLTNQDQIIINKDIPQTYIYFGMPGLSVNDENYYNLVILNYILGGGVFQSRLINELRIKRGYTYRARTSSDNYDYANVITGYFSTKTETVNDGIKVLKETLAELKDKGITEEEFTGAKVNILSSKDVNLDSNPSIASFMLNIQLLGFDKDYITKSKEAINNSSVEKINELAKKIIDFDKMPIIILGSIKNSDSKKK